MKDTLFTLERFQGLSRDGQLEHLLLEGELLPAPKAPEVSYYRVRDYYARVTFRLSPLQVEQVEGFDSGAAYERMVAELAA